MTPTQAKSLKVGQWVMWIPVNPTELAETGRVTRNNGKHVWIKWDDENIERPYDPAKQYCGFVHIELIDL
jgi:hypothetical protein